MKKVVLLACLLMCGCDNTASEIALPTDITMPDGLKDCKFFKIDAPGVGGIGYMRVVRCPNSSTTNVTGKSDTVTGIDE